MLGKILSYVGPALPYAASAGANIGLNAFNFYRTYSHFSNNPDHYKATEIIGYASCAVPAIAAAYIHSTNTLDYALLASTAVTAGCYAVNSLCRKDVKEVSLLVAASAVLGMQVYPKQSVEAIKAVYNATPTTGIGSSLWNGLGSVLSYAGTEIYNVASSCAGYTSTLLTSHNSYTAIGAHIAGAAVSVGIGATMMVSTLTTNKELDTRIRYLEDLNSKIIAKDPAHYSLNDTNALLAQAKNNAGYGTYGIIASALPIAAPLLLSATPAAIIAGAGIAAKVYLGGVVRDAAKETRTRYSEIRTGAQNLGIAV